MTKKQKQFQELQERWKDCMSCSLYQGRTNMVYMRGSLNPKLVFIGEAPGAEEDIEGKPFVGRAGKLLDQLIAAIDLHKDDYAIVNCVACRPPENRNPFPKEFSACSSRLYSLLEILDPKVVVLLGSVPFRMLAEKADGGITQSRGITTTANISRRGNNLQFPAIPTFHPSFLLRNGGFNGKLTPVVLEDIRKAVQMHQ